MTINRATDESSSEPVDLEPSLDHLVYAVTDLMATVTQFEALTGIAPAAGGAHIGRGTRNFLVGLGERSYLEIIGPDLDHPAPVGAGLPFGIDQLAGPRLLTWAVHPHDISAAAAASAEHGADLGEPMPMSRTTPSGRRLSWRIASSVPLPFSGVTPFLIDWGDSGHPATDPELPAARLLALEAQYPAPAHLRPLLDDLGMTLPVTAGPAGLTAVLETPNGRVRLS